MRLFLETRAEMKPDAVVRHYDAILWDMLTGNRCYYNVFSRIFQPRMFTAMSLSMAGILHRRAGKKCKSFFRKLLLKKNHLSIRAKTTKPSTSAIPTKQKHLLRSGFRVSIIGGGPAGTSCAISLMQLARLQNIDLEVTIHESKDFAAAAATWHPSDSPSFDKHINPCIGVLSPPIYEIITEKLRIPFPDHLVQKYIVGYVLHGRSETVTLDELFGASYAMRRITFDNYMMQQAIKAGAGQNLADVLDVKPLDKTFEIITSIRTVQADVVVGAFGVDQGLADVFERSFGYRRPEYMESMVVKYHPSAEFLRQFGLRINAFLPPLPEVEFGAITPKYNHLSINAAGRHIDKNIMEKFLALPQVADLLPKEYDEKGNPAAAGYYHGRFPTGPAGNIFAERMVIIGDASGMLRPFKGKGINAAILSGIAAARVIVHRGLMPDDFQKHYLPVFRKVTDDLWYARAARFSTNLLANTGAIDIILSLAKQSPQLRQALAEAVSGAATYHTILQRLTSERILWRSGASMLRQIITNKKTT